MFKTLEELQKRYPIGFVYHTSWHQINAWCPNKESLSIFKSRYPQAQIFKQSDNGIITAKEKYETIVDGYIFNGEYWYPAMQTWDGWQIIDEEECNI